MNTCVQYRGIAVSFHYRRGSSPSYETSVRSARSTTTDRNVMDVFILWHIHALPDGTEDAKLIGVYSSHALAEQAKNRAVMKPGFRDMAEGFLIDRYSVDQDHWTEGYITEAYHNSDSPGEDSS
jgi:hypothetical protein